MSLPPVPAGHRCCHCGDGAQAEDVGKQEDAAAEEDPLAQAADSDQGKDAGGNERATLRKAFISSNNLLRR